MAPVRDLVSASVALAGRGLGVMSVSPTLAVSMGTVGNPGSVNAGKGGKDSGVTRLGLSLVYILYSLF